MTKRLILASIGIFLMLAVVLMAATENNNRPHSMTSGPYVGSEDFVPIDVPKSRAIVWDNDMTYTGMLTAQIEDFVGGVDSEPADDFSFDVDQYVNDVHWVGGYYNGPPDDGDFIWRISFYDDIGGTQPGALLATWDFANSDVNETLIGAGYFNYSVDLPTSMLFVAGAKYWISIQGIGNTAPQSGWAYHEIPIMLHEAVFRSVYFGIPDWTPAVLGYSIDMCFQLTYTPVEECDWQPGDPYKHHYPQLPDETGWAVNATQPMILAEDFMCMETGWIKDFHFWGAWKHEDEGTVIGFQLSLHADIPATYGCVDTTWATGDCDGDGIGLAVADLVYLLQYLQGSVPAPNPLWEADMNGDCVVDQADADLYSDYFTYGLSVFAPYGGYPVPACCGPDVEIYSRPGETLWEFFVEDFDFTPVDPPTMEGWYDPATGEMILDDHTAYWQYNICLPEPFWFWQDYGTIYWVNISAIVADPQNTTWGWKSTQDHWNDDAVWGLWGDLNWIDIWEPYNDPRTNLFWVGIDLDHQLDPSLSGGTDFYGDGLYGTGWYEYFQPEWQFYNIWFYDHPFDYERKKTTHIEFVVDLIDYQYEGWLTFVVNWSTDIWSLEGQPPGDSMPPIGPFTPEDEHMFIGRDTLYDGPVYQGPHLYSFDWDYINYNPEWLSIDVFGSNFVILEGTGIVTHDCVPSLDLSLVVTNGELPPQEGACCDTVGNCYITDALTCANNGHLYEGDGTTCTPNPCDTCDYQDPGDVDLNGFYDVQDLIYLINYLYNGGPAPIVLANADVNGDCCIDWRDVNYLMAFIFTGGPPPVDCTCIYPPICIDPPEDHTPGDVKHNTDGYRPPFGDPTGTHWHELYDNYCTDWDVTDFFDNGDGILSFCDTLEFTNSADPTEVSLEHVILVTTTILVATQGAPYDTMYLDLVDPPNPLNAPLTNHLGSKWHEVYPDYCNIWQIVYSSEFFGGPLIPGNNIILQALSGPDSTSTENYNVLTVETDIVTEPASCCRIRGDALHNDLLVLVNDLVYLVNYVFKGGPPPPCLEEGDVVLPLDNLILVNDLVYLVNYVFKAGPPPPPC